MGTEHDRDYFPCPCGKGQIERDTTSPDHCWGGWTTSTSFSIECPECAKVWKIMDDGTLYDLNAFNANQVARGDASKLQSEERRLRREHAVKLAHQREPTPPKSVAAELRLLEEKYGARGFCYSTYLRDRKRRSFYDVLADRIPKADTDCVVTLSFKNMRAAAEERADQFSRAMQATSRKAIPSVTEMTKS